MSISGEYAAATARSIRRYPNLAGSKTEVDLALALLEANERLEQAERERDLLRFRHRRAILRLGPVERAANCTRWWSKIWN